MVLSSSKTTFCIFIHLYQNPLPAMFEPRPLSKRTGTRRNWICAANPCFLGPLYYTKSFVWRNSPLCFTGEDRIETRRNGICAANPRFLEFCICFGASPLHLNGEGVIDCHENSLDNELYSSKFHLDFLWFLSKHPDHLDFYWRVVFRSYLCYKHLEFQTTW